jgi:2-phospho-L-lactate guanylyltransferase
MIWTVVVPFKGAGERKSRLAGVLSESERDRFSVALLRHVANAVVMVPSVELLLLSPVPVHDLPGSWLPDDSHDLNLALEKARARVGSAPMAVVHADLPYLEPPDVEALLGAGERSGCSVAPDRHECGTNALAIASGRSFKFAFGSGSLVAHMNEMGRAGEITRRRGLALDIDTPTDLSAWCGASGRA